MVRPGQRSGPGRRRRRRRAAVQGGDAEAIAAQIGGVAAVAPEGRASVTVVANGRNWSTSVIGSSNAWFDTGNWKLASGRIFEADEQRAGAAVCIIGETVRREIFGGTRRRPRRTAARQAVLVHVIGVLAAKGQAAWARPGRHRWWCRCARCNAASPATIKVATLLVSMGDGSDSDAR